MIATAAPARPSRAARTPVAEPPGPVRMLLPPLREPQPDPMAAAAAMLPTLTSMRSTPTEGAWAHVVTRPARDAEPLADPAKVCGPIVLAAVETLSGARPLGQLARWVSPQIYDSLARRREAGGTRTGTVRRATVLRTRVCSISDSVAEASVVVHDGRRVRAGAVRLEVRRGQWRATVLQIG
ncbi:Rv3235 family protein [Cellulomonas bogoriensis]|uniref:Uncharacterized protein n=1 Tax=Cellulomonas bogoriensis 69B4 = DSM 16987 TaxID=1386082 RepID=A0A0A0BZZ7_9CELL|nr:Rv3235 family protein [Cellulomonas bogoriensis]KGM13526.1 hypothetical protein N869_13445 [Cellulomonas bogoriensis 69B4 = DSM 16987]